MLKNIFFYYFQLIICMSYKYKYFYCKLISIDDLNVCSSKHYIIFEKWTHNITSYH